MRIGLPVPPLVGSSAAMQRLQDEIACAARADAKVLVTGESGVGKELVGQQLHRLSRRNAGPLVTINCGGMSDALLQSELFGHVRGSFTGAYRDKPGKLEMAAGGTMFLDEVGEMSLRMQAALLRFLETGEIQRLGCDRKMGRVDVRVIAATNRRLAERVAAREFREDLYYRLNVICIDVPPLRERRSDVLALVHYYLEHFSNSLGVPRPELSLEALSRLEAYEWPGNIRELKNVVERIVVRSRRDRHAVAEFPFDRPHTVPQRHAAEPEVMSVAMALHERMIMTGQSFWAVVYPPFVAHDLTRADLRQLIDIGMAHVGGSVQGLLQLYNMQRSEYKRFAAFLRKHNCYTPQRESAASLASAAVA